MADKRFNLIFDVDANIGPIKSAISGLQGSLSKINIPDSFKKNLESTFTKLNNEIENFEAVSSKGFTNIADVGKAEKSFNRIIDLISKLRVQTGQLKGIDPNKFLPEASVKKVKELQQSWSKLKAVIEKGGGNSTEINKQTQELAKQEKELKNLETSYKALAAANKTMGAQKGTLSQSLEKDNKQADILVAKMSELEKIKGGKSTAEYKGMAADLKTLTGSIDRNQKQFDTLTATIDKNKAAMAGYSIQINAAKGNITSIKENLEQLKNVAQQSPEGLDELRQELANLKNVDISDIPTDIEQIGQLINSLNDTELQQISKSLGDVDTECEEVVDSGKRANDVLDDMGSQARGISDRAREVEQLANQVKQFFSIGNTVQLFKRAINSAFDTVKELDAVMTQTAVVTKFTVGDMWNQLPEYTKRANELGVSVKGAYEAATLYYQQGLETNEVIGVSNETLKMAKIAAIDYATATDYMTSALRGFNMEINEDSARRINDVYSELAARTAADTEEISIAMSKTAPLAHNAGMEIETTAALLSQMIETTREAPETLGTAMKTVIARFQELKKDPALIEPVDGEIIDANKIETALRTIGVALRDTSGQFRDLDDVFLEISSKWDSLDTNTQRYIATIAAGSRQQSRFIAMMANYERSTQLVAMANNAAGASQQQFEKTLESMQSKLDRLHNAWNEYVMGIANNQIIKGVVDALTGLLNTINKLTSAASGNKGLLKSLLDIGILMAGLKLAKGAFNGFFSWLVKSGKASGAAAGVATGQGFGAGINKALTNAKKLFTKSTWINAGNIIDTKAINDAKSKIETLRTTINQTKNDLENRPPNLFSDLNKATKEYQLALDGVGQTLTLTNAQQATSNSLQALGISEGIANAAAVGGLTTEKTKEYLATMIANGASEEEARIRLKNIAAIYAEAGAEEVANTAQQMGILTKVKWIALALFGSKATRAEALSKLGLAAADATATGAQTALNAAIYACPIGWILAGLAAIIALLVIFAKIANANSLENRMKKAAEETENAKKAADEAKEAYDNLLGDQNQYNELQKTLQDLTYGTQEWKQALVDANNQVLELLQTYPQLTKYLERGQYGQLTISDEGWDSIITAQEARVTQAQGALAYSQINQKALQKEALDIDLNKKFGYDYQRVVQDAEGNAQYPSEYDLTSFNYVEKETMAAVERALKAGFSPDQMADVLEQYGTVTALTAEELEAAAIAMLDYQQAVKQNELEMHNAASAFLTTNLSEEASSALNEVQGAAENIINGFSSKMVEAANDATRNGDWETLASDIWVSDGLAESEKEEGAFHDLAEQYADQIAELGTMVGDDVKDLRLLLAAMTGQTLEDIEDEYGKDKGRMAEAIARLANSSAITDQMNEFAEAFVYLGEEAQKQINVAMSEGASYVSGMEKNIDLEALYKANEETYKIIYGSFEEFENAYVEGVKNGQQEIADAKASLKVTRLINVAGEDTPREWVQTIGGANFGNGLDAGAISGLSEHLLQIFEVSGFQAANSLANKIQEVINNLDTEEAKKEFASILNGIDWESTDSVEQLSDRLEDLKASGEISEEQCEELEKQIIKLAKAARSVDLEKVAEQIKKLSKIQYDINNGEQDNQFSEDNYKALIEAGVASAGDFVYNLATDSWQYIGGSMETLSEAIGDNTDALLGLDTLRSSVRSSTAASDVRETYKNTIDTTSADSLAEGIKAYMEAAGDDNKIVSEDWLEDNINDVDALLEKWHEILGEAYAKEEREAKVAEVEQQGEQIKLQNNAATNNADLAIGGNQNALSALEAQASAAGMTADVYNRLTTAIREKTGAERDDAIQTLGNVTTTYQEAQAWGVDAEQVSAFADQLMRTGIVEEGNIATASALALANINLNTGLQTLSDNYDSYIGVLKAGLASEDAATRATTEYVTALGNTKRAVQQVLNTQAELSDGFIETAVSSGLLDKALTGSKEALQELYAMAGKDFVVNLGLNFDELENGINTIYKQIDDLTSEDVEIGATLDTTSFGEGLVDLLIASGATVDDINSAFEQIGWEPDFEYEEMSLDEAEQYSGNTNQQVLVPNGIDENGVTQYKVMTIQAAQAANVDGTTMVRVPTIKGKGNGQKGSNFSSLSQAMGAKTTFKGSTAPKVSPSKNYTPKGSGGGGGGGGGSEKEEEPWENPYDWLYNLTQKINAELRIREKLERRYQRLLKTYSASGAELKKITDQELASLEKRKKLEEQMIELRKKELKEYLAANAALAKYASIDWELEVVTINWDKIDAVTDKEEGEKIEEYISKLEELIKSIQDAEDAVEDIEDDIIDLKQRGKDQYRDLEDRVLSALISEQQDIIDNQEKINNSITEAASDLENAISKNIQQLRQDRQNEETETSLAEKERRLAYLRQDTTGSNALEIKKLEQDLAKEKQSYQDALIDQSLNDLKEQNDAAAKQREKQIELMQSQLDWQEKTGYFVDEATRIVREGLGPNGVMSENTRLYQLLQEQEEFFSKSNASRDQWNEELANAISEAFVWLKNGLGGSGGSQESGARDYMSEMIAQSNKGRDANAGMVELEKLENARNAKIDAQEAEGIDNGGYEKTYMVSNYKKGQQEYNSGTLDASITKDIMAAIDVAIANKNWADAFRYAGARDAKIKAEGVNSQYASDFTFDYVFDKWYAAGGKKFKRGGLADYTGPAWLDGTKSKPEAVLNARDTENFIQLRDVLAGLRANIAGANSSGGDWYFDIDINVDEIANDYDVDRVAERVKQSIYNETTYRNVNAINFLK